MAGRHIIRARWRVPNPVPALDGVRRCCDLSGCACELTAAAPGSNGHHRAGICPRHRMEPHMSDLSLAQNHALDLARTLCHAKEPG